ncbi:DNA-directed RNA polymerase I subunit RPA34.5-domain-containing protein [Pyronema omphalodes]|nr:DNA-directed RNA polymerase I subunit RPA34.5-domain-containing protein [Pyronema omphalodes]
MAGTSTKKSSSSSGSKKTAAESTTPAKATKNVSSETVSDTDMEDDSEEEEQDLEQTKAVYKFKAPIGFDPLSKDKSLKTNPFTAANLKGKEIWLISAPAEAPLTKLAKIVAQDVAEGNPVMQTKGGRSYLLKNEEEGEKVVMVPGADGFYRQSGQPVTRTFRLVETLPTPKVIKPEDVPASKPVRLQPEGLRMRYKPFGATGGDLEYQAADPDAMDLDEPVPRPDEDRKKKRHKSSEDKEKKDKDKKKKKRKSTGGDE